jgi:hypothetical protein
VRKKMLGARDFMLLEKDDDWGQAEQSAFERLNDDKADFVSGEELLEWIEALEKGTVIDLELSKRSPILWNHDPSECFGSHKEVLEWMGKLQRGENV